MRIRLGGRDAPLIGRDGSEAWRVKQLLDGIKQCPSYREGPTFFGPSPPLTGKMG